LELSAMTSCISVEGSDSEVFTDAPEELKEAIKRGDVETVIDALDAGANLQHCYANGITPLHLAVLHEQLDVVKLLMKRSADPLARTTDECKLSPIDLAHVQNQQAILDSLCAEEPHMPVRRRFAGPCCLVSLIACNSLVFMFIYHQPGFEASLKCKTGILTLVSLCLFGLVLSNSLDPGEVTKEEVHYLQDWRKRPEAEVKLPRDPTEDEMFYLLPNDSDEDKPEEPFRWCRSCELWRPPGVSHCAECRRCFWRMDHHCWMIGNCVAMRNHRFFTLTVLSGCLAWATAFVKTVWDAFVQESQKHMLEFQWSDVVPVLFSVWSILGLSFLVPFSLFHVSALICNITSKNSCGHRRLNWQQRRVNGLTEYGEIFCGPMSPRPCEEAQLRKMKLQNQETSP